MLDKMSAAKGPGELWNAEVDLLVAVFSELRNSWRDIKRETRCSGAQGSSCLPTVT